MSEVDATPMAMPLAFSLLSFQRVERFFIGNSWMCGSGSLQSLF